MDQGGIPENMFAYQRDKLSLNFDLQFYATSERGKWLAARHRTLQAYHSDRFDYNLPHPNVGINRSAKESLTEHLTDLNVSQIAFTRLSPIKLATEHLNDQDSVEMPRLRIRLDFTEAEYNVLKDSDFKQVSLSRA